MLYNNIYLLFIVIFYIICSSNGLDVSWIPNDPDGPLPLSIQYRQSLRRLCLLIDKGSRLPPEVEAKKNVLKKMCTKLKYDDDSIQSSINYKHSIKNVAIFASSLGGSYFIWHNRKVISNIYNNIIRSLTKRSSSSSIDSDQMLQDIREARLKRFQ